SRLTALTGFQVGLARDIDLNSFALGKTDKVIESQEWLAGNCPPGKSAELGLDVIVDGCPSYEILIAGRKVARRSTNFGWAIWHSLKNLNDFKPKKFPRRISGVWVKEIVTSVGDIGDDRIDRVFRTSGLWTTLSLEGLGKCEWK